MGFTSGENTSPASDGPKRGRRTTNEANGSVPRRGPIEFVWTAPPAPGAQRVGLHSGQSEYIDDVDEALALAVRLEVVHQRIEQTPAMNKEDFEHETGTPHVDTSYDQSWVWRLMRGRE